MEKPASLRKALEHAIPDLKANPDQFLMLVSDGSIRGIKHSLSHTEHYNLDIAIFNFTGHIEHINITLLDWLQTCEPDLLGVGHTPEDSICFEIEHIDNQQVNVLISLKLKERVIVQTVDGKTTYQHPLPPQYEPWLTWPETQTT